MTKVPCKDFLCGQMQSWVPKPRETWTFSGSKSGAKTDPGQDPNHRKARYTSKSCFKRASKKGVQNGGEKWHQLHVTPLLHVTLHLPAELIHWKRAVRVT